MPVLSRGQGRTSHFSTTSSTEDMLLRNSEGGYKFQQMGGKNSQHLYVLTALRAQKSNALCAALNFTVPVFDHTGGQCLPASGRWNCLSVGRSTLGFFCFAALRSTTSSQSSPTAWIMLRPKNNLKTPLWKSSMSELCQAFYFVCCTQTDCCIICLWRTWLTGLAPYFRHHHESCLYITTQRSPRVARWAESWSLWGDFQPLWRWNPMM